MIIKDDTYYVKHNQLQSTLHCVLEDFGLPKNVKSMDWSQSEYLERFREFYQLQYRNIPTDSWKNVRTAAGQNTIKIFSGNKVTMDMKPKTKD